MQTVSFSALDQGQLAQVAYLFADEIFGTDASAFEYELNGKGNLTGRRTAARIEGLRVNDKGGRSTGMRVTACKDAITNARDVMSIDALSALLAKKFMEYQLEEAHHE